MSSQLLVTTDDKGPLIGICAVLAIVFAGVALGGRLYTKLAVMRRLAVDDCAILPAVASGFNQVFRAWLTRVQFLATAQSTLVVIAAQNGLGRREPVVTPSNQSLIDNTVYAADLLYIATVALVKISVALFITTIAPSEIQKRVTRGYSGVVALWGVSSLFAAAFVCKPGAPALLGVESCFGRALAFWNSFGALNILSDIFLLVWPFWIFISIQAALKQRLMVIFWFSTRIATVAATIAQLVYLNRLSSRTERTFNAWPLVICTQAVLSLSIITACVPCVRPFLEKIDSGMLRSDNILGRGVNGSYYAYGSHGDPNKVSAMTASFASRNRRNTGGEIPLTDSFKSIDRERGRRGTMNSENAESTSSQARIILQESP